MFSVLAAALNHAIIANASSRYFTARWKTKSAILNAVHDAAKGRHKAGVMDQVTLREFDRLCLPPVEPLAPEQVKQVTHRRKFLCFVVGGNLAASVAARAQQARKIPVVGFLTSGGGDTLSQFRTAMRGAATRPHRDLCRSTGQGRKSRRSSGGPAHEVRTGD
ncbi:MAG: hypothetical protein WKH97_11175 [Casimicrobiaceae bacterium]